MPNSPFSRTRSGRVPALDPALASDLARTLRAVAHPLRLRLLTLLCRAETSVGVLSESLAVPQPIVSQQLRILRTAGLVSARRREGRAPYRVIEPHLAELLRCVGRCGRRRRSRAAKEGR
jgi:DNA-binding transcriptional ArsR family regulator